MWRLVYAKRKLTLAEKQALEIALDGLSFSCGSELQDADIPPAIKDVVFVKKLQCTDTVERLYYSANLKDICIYCSEELPESEESTGILSSMF